MPRKHGDIEGRIFREGKRVIVRVGDKEKVFEKKPIYLPGEYKQAFNKHLQGNDVVVIGMNGYSSLKEETCQAWGVRLGAYEAACAQLLTRVVQHLRGKFPGIDVRLVHGASDMGVDREIINVARLLNVPQLGHSCPKFMLYVQDDDIPVYVAKTQRDYADSFIDSLHILIAANGRMHAFEHDIDAAFKKLKYVIPINVIKAISTTGGPPAISADGEIDDAVAAFEQRIRLISTQTGLSGSGIWDTLNSHVQTTTADICRQIISPTLAFSLLDSK